jgi:hypothetical protein
MKTIEYSKKPPHFVRPNDAQLPQRRAKRASAQQQQTTLASSRAVCNASSKHAYSGQELRPYTGRPGSLDHLDLPNRIGETLFYRSRANVKTVRQEQIT